MNTLTVNENSKSIALSCEEWITAFKSKENFNELVDTHYDSKDEFVEYIRQQLGLAYDELIQYLSNIVQIEVFFPFLESGKEYECRKKIISQLHLKLNEHDSKLLMIFERSRPLFSHCEELLSILAYVTNRDYKYGDLVDIVRPIFKGVYTLLDENQDSDKRYNMSYPLSYYADRSESWEVNYLEDHLPVHKLLSMLPFNNLDCIVMYKVDYINEVLRELQSQKFRRVLYDVFGEIV